jgi:hypothetical protein
VTVNPDKPLERKRQFKLRKLANLGQILAAGSKVLRAMADGSIDRQLGASLMAGLHVQRGILELQAITKLEAKLALLELRDISPTNNNLTRRLEDYGRQQQLSQVNRTN